MISWDEVKNKTNQEKHDVSFEIAQLIFDDPHCLTHQDQYENGEYRWQTIGMVEGVLLLLVAHTYEDNTDVRIISARRVTKKERKLYEEDQ